MARVCGASGLVVCYAYAGTFNPRAAYQWTVETSVYLRKGCERKGQFIPEFPNLI